MNWREISGWFDDENYEMFKTIKLPKKPLVVEIGTYCGKSAHALRELYPDARIITCDLSSSPLRVSGDYEFHCCRGQDLAIEGKIDLLFIDALHTYVDTKELFEKFKDQADIVVFHDYHFEHSEVDGVRNFIHELGNCQLFTDGEFGGAVWRNNASNITNG